MDDRFLFGNNAGKSEPGAKGIGEEEWTEKAVSFRPQAASQLCTEYNIN